MSFEFEYFGADPFYFDDIQDLCEEYDRNWEAEYEAEDYFANSWNDDDWPEYDYDDWGEYLVYMEETWNESPWVLIHAHSIHDKKLQKFMEAPVRHRRFDPEVAPYNVQKAFCWYDSVHHFAHNKGYMNAHKKVMGIIEKYSVYHTDAICKKLKSHVEYKATWQFRHIVERVVSAMRNPRQDYPYEFGFKVQEHGHLYKPGEPLGHYFPYAEFDEYKFELKSRAMDLIGWKHGTFVYVDDEFLTIKVVRNRKKPIIITKSIYELFKDKSHESWLKSTLETLDDL